MNDAASAGPNPDAPRYLEMLELAHGRLQLPAFLPDATQGVVRSVDAADLAASHIQALQMNVYHLMLRPGSSTVRALGGLHKMSGWSRPIFTDSGGFQIYSLIRQDPKSGSLTNRGATFRPEGSTRKFQLTPEKSVQLQLSYGSDLVICLDDCTHPDDPVADQAESVQRTIHWARRCKEEFDRALQARTPGGGRRPLLMAVIQGGRSPQLRRRCAEALLDIGFDLFGYGGWPLDSEGTLLSDMLALTRQLVPLHFPVHALGVGHPRNIVDCARLGYELFDSTMPTRDARHGRLYTFTCDPAAGILTGDWFEYLYVKYKKHVKAGLPISPYCDCTCCTRYTLGYLHHLYKLNDTLYPRLATIHNLRFMTLLMENLRSFGRT